MLKNSLKRSLVFLGVALILGGLTATSASAATVQPAASNDFLTNPGMGWQNMGSANLLPETVAYPDRQDVSWRTLNPGDGNYNWQALDSRLQQAISQGKQFSFRVYTMRGEDYGGHYMPDWVVSKGAKTLSNGEVDYSNCTYQAEWAKFVEALRQKYDGNPNIAYIDVSGYGNFNEWSWQDSQTDWDDDALNPTTIDGQARRRLADMFIGGSQNSHRCTNGSGQTQTVSYSYPGFQTTQLIMPYAGIRQSTYYVDSRRSDVGFRYDCLGKSGLKADHQEKLGNVLNDLWKTAPVAYELCGINWSSSSFINSSREVLEWAHASFVHDNPNGPGNVSAAQGLLRQVGYRYLLTQANYPDQVSPGGQIQIATTWQNVGYAPSYPKMGQNFELHFYLVDQSNSVAADLIIPTNISQWLPANTLPGTAPANSAGHTATLPAGLANGSYKTQIAIIDKRTNKPINLAIAGRDASGRYNLGTISVAGGSGATPTPTPTATPTATPTPTGSATPTPSPTATPTPTPNNQQIICQADINQDGTVNHQDYLILRQNFFSRVLKNARADINRDGSVNLRDYLLYARNRNKTCTTPQ